MRTLSAVGFPHWELTNGEAEKVKAYVSFVRSECMRDSRFVRAEPESHVFEPFRYECRCFLQFLFVGMEHHKIVGISYDNGFPILILCLLNGGLHSVQSDIHE